MNPDLLTWPQRGQLWLRLGIRAALVIGAVLLTVFVAVPLVSLLMPFVRPWSWPGCSIQWCGG